MFKACHAMSMAEGRGKAQADSLRQAKKDLPAKKLAHNSRQAPVTAVSSAMLRKDDLFLVEAGDAIPCDGEILEGIASVDESAITGESAPVIREAGGDRSAVTGGTKVLSDWLVVRVTAEPGQTFLDRMLVLTQRLAEARGVAVVADVAGRAVQELLDCGAAVLVPDTHGASSRRSQLQRRKIRIRKGRADNQRLQLCREAGFPGRDRRTYRSRQDDDRKASHARQTRREASSRRSRRH